MLKGIETFQHLIMRLVRIVIRLTPYGVLALMARVVATSNVKDVINLGSFVVASYVGMMIIMLHARDDPHAGRAQPGALLPEDLAGADVRVHLALERGGDSAQRRDAGRRGWACRRRSRTSPPASAPRSARTRAPDSILRCWR